MKDLKNVQLVPPYISRNSLPSSAGDIFESKSQLNPTYYDDEIDVTPSCDSSKKDFILNEFSASQSLNHGNSSSTSEGDEILDTKSTPYEHYAAVSNDDGSSNGLSANHIENMC
jgi:hypothetical protein